MKLSLIICVYNTDKALLRECLASITNTTLRREDYEILVIDDGSSVDYTDLWDEYSVRCIKTENHGIFMARMEGLQSAFGDYIAFVDSDDTVSFNYHRPMMDKLDLGYDIVYNDWAFHTERTRYYLRGDSTITGDIEAKGDDVLPLFFSKSGREHSYYVLWNKMYRREVVTAALPAIWAAVSEVDNFNYSEDALLNFFFHKEANSLVNIHTGYYFYRVHSSQTVSVPTEERLLSQVKNMAFTIGVMRTNVYMREDSEELLPHISEWGALMSRTHFSHARMNGWVDAYETIKEAYGVERLERSILSDGAVYQSTALIGDNIKAIDEALYSIYLKGEPVVVRPHKDRYVRDSLNYLLSYGVTVTLDPKAEFIIPAMKNKVKDKILHNDLVRFIGVLLFPKGSKIRAFLKSRL